MDGLNWFPCLLASYWVWVVGSTIRKSEEGRRTEMRCLFLVCLYMLVTAPPLHAYWPVDSDSAMPTSLREWH